MSRPEPKPALLEALDAAAYGLATERLAAASAQLDAARARLELAERAAQDAEQSGMLALQHITTKYELGDRDGFNWRTGAITRQPVSPTNADILDDMRKMQRELLQELGHVRDGATTADTKKTAPPVGANGAADHVRS
jgi:hypothetical protein